jgi:hypothetical protein
LQTKLNESKFLWEFIASLSGQTLLSSLANPFLQVGWPDDEVYWQLILDFVTSKNFFKHGHFLQSTKNLIEKSSWQATMIYNVNTSQNITGRLIFSNGLIAMEFLIEDTKKQILISNFQRQKKYLLIIPKFKQE